MAPPVTVLSGTVVSGRLPIASQINRHECLMLQEKIMSTGIQALMWIIAGFSLVALMARYRKRREHR